MPTKGRRQEDLSRCFGRKPPSSLLDASRMLLFAELRTESATTKRPSAAREILPRGRPRHESGVSGLRISRNRFRPGTLLFLALYGRTEETLERACSRDCSLANEAIDRVGRDFVVLLYFRRLLYPRSTKSLILLRQVLFDALYRPVRYNKNVQQRRNTQR